MPDPNQKQPNPDKPPKKNMGLIFIVEDDSFLRNLLKVKLEKEGFTTEEITDGQKAVERLKETVPTLILLDLLLPIKDGFQVLEEIRKEEKTKNVPVIVLSNLGEREHMEKAKRLGADEYLIKAHFILDEIVKKIAEVVRKRYL